jgi:hypothetical protein
MMSSPSMPPTKQNHHMSWWEVPSYDCHAPSRAAAATDTWPKGRVACMQHAAGSGPAHHCCPLPKGLWCPAQRTQGSQPGADILQHNRLPTILLLLLLMGCPP